MQFDETMTVMLSTGHGAEPEPVEIPLRVGTVKLGEMLGEGASGVVFAGFDEALNRKVAVKVMHRRRGDSSKSVEVIELARGVRAAAGVKHPNIVTIHAIETAADMPVIVMEYVDGLSLRDLLPRCGPMDLSLALYVMRSIASAAAALHEAGVVHRDLKPANVLFDSAGRARVCDFGLACEFDAADYRGRADEVGGSPLYMAPETYEAEISPMSDVYSLGVMLFEALAGVPPFSASTISELQICHQSHDPPIWQLERLGVPEEVEQIVRRALHKRRYLRFKTAGRMLTALEGVEAPELRDEVLRMKIAEIAASFTDGASRTEASKPESTPARTTFDLIAERARQKREDKTD